jgi:nitrous-oxide reductase
MIAKWNYVEGKLIDRIPVHYNIGHIMTMHGDTVKPRGKYVVALNKLAIDRFNPVGPLHPQNHQLIDIRGDKMQLLYDMPIPLGEPHYVVAIDATLLKPIVRFPAGTNSRTDEISPGKTKPGEERIVKNGKKVEVFGTQIRSHFTPEIIEVDEGDEVTIWLTNLERAEDQTHGFTVGKYNVNGSLEPGKTSSFRFVADKPGVFPYYCTEFCSALHLEMQGYLLVKPTGWKGTPVTAKAGAQYTQAEYDKQIQQNVDTQKVIDGVVAYITARDYAKYPMVAALVEDATDQLGKVPEMKAKAEVAAAAGNWNDAMLWANQWFQYQVKAADIGLRAKAQLDQLGAQPK